MPVRLEAGVEIVAEQGADRRLVFGREKLEAEIGGMDAVGFLDHQVAPVVEPVDGAGEGEAEQEAEQREDRAIENAGLLPARGLLVSHPDPEAGFQQD